MLHDAAEMTARYKPQGFEHLKVDGRTRHARMAEHCLQALYADLLAGVTDLTASDRLDVENAALAEARLRQLQEREMSGDATAVDVTAAWHLARKARRTVQRIARRTRAKRGLGR